MLPAEETQLQQMQQAGDLHFVPEQYGSCPVLGAETRQPSVVLEPEPAEHLDHEGRQEHEADQHPKPEKVPAKVKLCGHPHVRATVYEESTHSHHGEDEIDPGVFRKRSVLHDGAHY